MSDAVLIAGMTLGSALTLAVLIVLRATSGQAVREIKFWSFRVQFYEPDRGEPE